MMEVITDGDGAASGTEVVDQNNQAISVVHVAIPNQPVQVQSVIHPNQPSVIQTTGGGGAGGNMQTIQVSDLQTAPHHRQSDKQQYQILQVISADDDDDPDGKKRREILARRPSYRRILNDLSSSDGPVIPGKIEEESSNSSQQDSQEATDAANNLSQASALQQQLSSATIVPAQALQLAQGDGGLQTLTMSNVSSAQTSTTGATIVQYAQGPDGQFFIPGNVQAYQITTTPSSIPQGVVMATTGSAIASPHQLSEEASRKRELRLLKNRDAARECRRKKKDYIKCLENRVAVLENQNKTLIEELQSLKELYCQKEG